MELLERQEEERMEAVRRSIIEQERQKLLKEHASKLLGYLPKVSTLIAILLLPLSRHSFITAISTGSVQR